MHPTSRPVVDQLVELLGQPISDRVVADALMAYGLEPPSPGEDVSRSPHGFDVVYEDGDGLDWAGNGSKSRVIHSVRLFSPEYAARNGTHSYLPVIVHSLTFPLSVEQVRSALGSPTRTSTSAERYDEYDFPQCSMRFVKNRKSDRIVFVQLILPPGRRTGSRGLSDPTSPGQRLAQLEGHRRTNWKTRLAAYEGRLGSVIEVYPDHSRGIDILVFNDGSEYITLITNGMSDRPMSLPTGSPDPRRAELMLYVSSVDKYSLRRLDQTANFPFVEATHVNHGDTIDWGLPIAPGSNLTADLILYSTIKSHQGFDLSIGGDLVQPLWCVPITDEELDLKMTNGLDALLHIFDVNQHPLTLSLYRNSYV